MYNKDFIDIMDKINTIAKSKNFTNGIALARNLFENKQLNTYDYVAFENCHNLRNLMAHGFSRDINISDETMEIARLFYTVVRTPKTPSTASTQSEILKEEDMKLKYKLTVQEGDYVIAMQKEKSYWSTFKPWSKYSYNTAERKSDRSFYIGDMFCVGNQRKLKHVKDSKEYTIDELLKNYSKFYVLRLSSKKVLEPNNEFYVIDEPKLNKSADGKCTLLLNYTTTTQPIQKWAYMMEEEGYLAHPDCFRLNNPKMLYSMGLETVFEYLNEEKESQSDLKNDSFDLPF